jgi:hypothetical protein
MKVGQSDLPQILQRILLMGVAVSLGACCDVQTPVPKSQGIYPASSATVRKVQIALRNRGYYAGSIDGFLGQDTAVGIERFQIDRDERVMPIIDRSLLVSLGIASH